MFLFIDIILLLNKMGSFISAHTMFSNNYNSNNNNKICFKCSKIIEDKTYIICVRCKIALHETCEKTYGFNYYTVCPHCDRCGSLGTFYSPK
jgi:uncharacterized paraquat-inducible protein A